MPADHSVKDWGVTYEEMEPYYTRAENLIGASGKAGNIQGRLIEGGNIFEGVRSGEYPTPPTTTPYFSALFRDAAKSLGYHPFPGPNATLSEAHTNPDGVSRPGCVFCGFCNMYGCMIGAKAQPTNVLLPVIKRHKNVTIRTGPWVRRLVREKSPNGRVRGVTYKDSSGDEVFQPADLVILATWTLNNTRLLLLSEIGEPYDPATGKGNVGRNLTADLKFAAAKVLMEKPLNRFMGSAPTGIYVGDLESGVLDNTDLPFLRGGLLRALNSGYQPIGTFGRVPQSGQIYMGLGMEEGRRLLVRPDGRCAMGWRGIRVQKQLPGSRPHLQRRSRRSANSHDHGLARETNGACPSLGRPKGWKWPEPWEPKRSSHSTAWDILMRILMW